MELFFKGLVQKFDKEKKDWRAETLIVMENASYHCSPSTIKLFKELQMPVCFTGPHSYESSPAEKVFAFFKQNDINPNKLPTGKT